MADGVLASDSNKELISPEEYGDLKSRFVQEWAKRVLDLDLDPEQAGALAATKSDIEVVARAGSGKTRTLVTRAMFLQRHCRIAPHELLLLAFNRKAAEEMKARLAKAAEQVPHVMTFHALAYALVHPDKHLLYDDVSADQLGLSREIQEVIDEHLRSQEFGPLIRQIMLVHFREDWERIHAGRFELTMEEFLANRRELPRETLKGDYVKSFGEKVIANALFEHSVDYRYERNFRWDGLNYRPDFTVLLPKGGIVIEYFGLKGDPDYDEMSEAKRNFWAHQADWRLIELTPDDLLHEGVEGFTTMLLRKLRSLGVQSRHRSDEEIWELIRQRAIDGFTGAMKNFIERCRRRDLRPEDLEHLVASHSVASEPERWFLRVAISVYREYLQHLEGKEDFDGLLWEAVWRIHGGHTRFVRDKGKERGDLTWLRYIMIDEFQDFSEMFCQLVHAIREINPRARFFCVGDDWQAINGFAGSDLRFFRDFAQHFRDTSVWPITTNYRSPRSVVEVGNALMHGRGPEAKAHKFEGGSVLLCDLAKFAPTPAEHARHGHDEFTPALLRLLTAFLAENRNVVLLARRNGLPWFVEYDRAIARELSGLERFLEHMRVHLPQDDGRRISISTVHKYKGRERDAVIVLDALQRSYPLIHPNWVFLRLFGDGLGSIVDEERRLFYVALTRAKKTLAVLTELGGRESSFLEPLRHSNAMQELTWDKVPPAPPLDGQRLEVRVFNAYGVRDQLKRLGYHFQGPGRYWYKAVFAERFSSDALLRQPWKSEGVRVEVYSETGELLHSA